MLRSRKATVAGLVRRGARFFSHGWSSAAPPPLMPQRRVVVTGTATANFLEEILEEIQFGIHFVMMNVEVSCGVQDWD